MPTTDSTDLDGARLGEPMLDLLAGFIVELREAGLPVSLTENLDAMEAVKHIPLEDREAFKYALAATLVKNNAHWRAFETVFEVYFSLRGRQYAHRRRGRRPLDARRPRRAGRDGARTARARAGPAAAGASALTPEELAEMLYQALLEGNEALLRAHRPPGRPPLRRHGAGPPGRRHLLPVPHAAEPRPRRRARAADGADPRRTPTATR